MNKKILLLLFITLSVLLFGCDSRKGKIELEQDSQILYVGDTYQITPKISGDYTYEIVDLSIATVSATGLIEALKSGSTTINISLNGRNASFSLTVKDKEIDEEKEKKSHFNHVIEETAKLSNYTLEINFKDSKNETAEEEFVYQMIMKIDGSKIKVSIDTIEHYYVYLDHQYHIYKTPEGYVKEKVEKNPYNLSVFYKTLTYSDFQIMNEKYYLNYNRYSVLDPLKGLFSGSESISNFVLSIDDTHINNFNFYIKINGIDYHLSFDFKNIHTTSVEVPNVIS